MDRLSRLLFDNYHLLLDWFRVVHHFVGRLHVDVLLLLWWWWWRWRHWRLFFLLVAVDLFFFFFDQVVALVFVHFLFMHGDLLEVHHLHVLMRLLMLV